MNSTRLSKRQINGTTHVLLLLFLLAMPSTGTAAGGSLTFAPAERELAIDYSFVTPDPTKQLAGFKLYEDGTEVCASSNPTVGSMDCVLTTKDGTFDFVLAAYYSDNTESPTSDAYSLAISSTHTVDFTWTASNNWSSRGGFRIYDNGVLVQEITDSSARQFTYTGEFSSPDHNYTITAVSSHGNETLLSDALTSREVLPPAAVIASSTAAGSVPLTVNFDGSSSTATNSPLVSYSWTFGDGSQDATGAKTSHVYTTAGTYYAKLTVKDSLGLTNTVSTPIVVGQSAGPNQKPTGIIAADPSQGGAPLTVSFDGSKSSDPDGSIVDYSWNFGDGTIGSGATLQHTFADSGSYTVTLQVTDDKGATGTASSNIQVGGGQLPMEVGEVSLDNQWVKVMFESAFTDPVVIAGPPTTLNEDEPVTVRIRNIDKQGFEIRLQEWEYQDGTHAPETVNYLVVEKGTYTLANGGKVEAGSFTGGPSFAQTDLRQTYKAAPVILSQVVSNNETDAVTGRVRNVTGNSFEYKLQEMERTATAHIPETVNYIAWEPGKGDASGFLYEAAATTQNVTQNWAGLNFQTKFPGQPAILAGMQTAADDDTATVRCNALTPTAVKTRIEEDQSKDKEVKHGGEAVGYLAIGATSAQP